MTREVEVKRDDYTWAMAASDLALTTPLTINEAVNWTVWAKDNGMHPYDALPLLANIVRSLPDVHVGPMFFHNVAALFRLKSEEPSKT